jgi:hypothetical protein
MRIRTCALRLQEINAMLPYLPSDHGGTKQNIELDDTELCSILLRMIPRSMENAFWIQSNDVICSDWNALVEKLEQIEQSGTLDTVKGNGAPKREGGAGGSRGARGAKVTFANGSGTAKGNAAKARGGRGAKHRSPGNKHCSKCAEKGGAHWSHNTKDCTRHGSADAPTKSGGGDRVSKSAFSQYKKKYDTKLKLMGKKLKKLKRNGKKLSDDYDSDSDSDSS